MQESNQPALARAIIGGAARAKERSGSHVAYARGPDLVVEWYDFGEHAPYESANLVIFATDAQAQLARAIGTDEQASPQKLATKVAAHFRSYFDVKDFAEERGIAFTTETDFLP